MSAPTCAQCRHGTITAHSAGDKCSSPSNAGGYHPYALRHDETLCGAAGAWYAPAAEKSVVYRAADAVKSQ